VAPARTSADIEDAGRARRRLVSRGRASCSKRFGDLWVDPEVPGKLRQEAAHELFGRIDASGPEVVALHPRPNENAWLLGYAAMKDGSLMTQERVGMLGATGLEPIPGDAIGRVGPRAIAERPRPAAAYARRPRACGDQPRVYHVWAVRFLTMPRSEASVPDSFSGRGRNCGG